MIEDSSKLHSDILLLYELSLSIGQSQDLRENCKAFTDVLMARKSLSYCSVWIVTGGTLQEDETGDYGLIYSTPESRTWVREIPTDHPGVTFEGRYRSCNAGSATFDSLVHEKDIEGGSYAVFKLKNIGFLKLYRSGDARFSDRELNQLAVVVDKFAVSLAGALSHTRLMMESVRRREAQLSLEHQQALMRSLIDSVPDLIFYKDMSGHYIGCNRAFEAYAQCSERELIGKSDLDLFDPQIAVRYRTRDKEVLDSGEARRGEQWITYPDGRRVLMDTLKTPYYGPDDELLGLIGISRDITEQKSTERALQRAQKMDALGQLTGGIAHDFNNILGIILGNLDLISKQGLAASDTDERLTSIEKSARRASELTSQLLGFSRHKPATSKVCNLNELIEDMDSLISRSLTPEVEIINDLTMDLWDVDIDPGDFQDAVLNIVLNAHDAMSGRGTLQIRSDNVLGDEISHVDATIGESEYVHLAISDTGCGMQQETLDRIFEPFYTTKSTGKGTGLGLSMVYGFITRSNGHIEVSSHPGAGTQINLYFPRAEARADSDEVIAESAEQVPTGNETIMIVDDEEMLLMLAEDMFRELGYNTLTAADGSEALELLSANDEVDLLFSDVVMPGKLNGLELARQARSMRPGLKVLLTSGYNEVDGANESGDEQAMPLLVKPYQLSELASKVRTTLDEQGMAISESPVG